MRTDPRYYRGSKLKPDRTTLVTALLVILIALIGLPLFS
mgnify:CR=1 FL=1